MMLYRRRSQYKRLRSAVFNEETEKIPKSKASQKKFWKFKVTPKLRVKVSSSMVKLKRLRDAYVESMLCFAGRVMQLNNGNLHLFKSITTPKISA